MVRKTIYFLLSATIIFAGVFLYMNYNPERGPHLGEISAPGEGRTKVNREGGLEVIATFLSDADDGTPEELLFKIELKGPKAELTGHDPAELASLINAREERLSTGFVWEDETLDAESRTGFLRVPNQKADGQPFWDKGIDSLTLVFRDLGGVVERKLNWVF